MEKLIIILFSQFILQGLCAQQRISLYKDSIPNSIGKLNEEQKPFLELYLPISGRTNGTSIIIIPGGAYSFLAYAEEGTLIAKAFANKGIASFVLKYRLPQKSLMVNKSIGPIIDAQQAIKFIRSNAARWGINPGKIGVIGFSAGGHLASTMGTHFNRDYIQNPEKVSLRPDFMALIYPVITMEDSITHIGSKISLLGMTPSKELVKEFSNELQVTETTPPTYITHCGDDQTVDVNNSIVFYRALQNKGVDAELHLFPKGNHGFIQRLPINEWLDPILQFLKNEGFYSHN